MRIVMMFGLALAACQSGAAPGTLDQSATPLHVQVRLRGVATDGYQNVLLDVMSLRASADGSDLAVTAPQSRMDLADTSLGWIAGELDVPAGAKSVHLALTFDEFGGFDDGAGAGEIDARTVPVQIDAPVANLAMHGKAVVQLDVARSLIPAGPERRLLLPSMSVAY